MRGLLGAGGAFWLASAGRPGFEAPIMAGLALTLLFVLLTLLVPRFAAQNAAEVRSLATAALLVYVILLAVAAVSWAIAG